MNSDALTRSEGFRNIDIRDPIVCLTSALHHARRFKPNSVPKMVGNKLLLSGISADSRPPLWDTNLPGAPPERQMIGLGTLSQCHKLTDVNG